MQILSRLALALAVLATGCDTNTCLDAIDGSTSGAVDVTTGEEPPPPAPKYSDPGEWCDDDTLCAPGLFCLRPGNYCSRDCTVDGETCEDLDVMVENVAIRWHCAQFPSAEDFPAPQAVACVKRKTIE